jgi:hypothetical protein
MKSKGLLIASILLLALTTVIWWSNKKSANPEKKSVDNTSTKLLTVTEEQIQYLEIKKRPGESVRLIRSDSSWQIAGPEPLRADPDAVSGILSTLSSLNSDRTVEEKASSLGEFGLAQPAIELTVIEKSGKTEKLLIGDDTPAGSAVYAAMSGDPHVYALSSYKKNSFDKSLNDLKNKRLFDFRFADPERIEIRDASKNYLLTRSGSDWSSNGTKMDASSVSALVDKIRDLSASSFVNTGFGAATLTIAVTSDGGKRPEKILLSKRGDKFLAKREGEPPLYEIEASTVTEIQKLATDLKPLLNPPKSRIENASPLD